MSAKREQLETTAIAQVQRTGLGALSFRTLAELVGIKSASVHYHFPEKGDLAGAIITKYSADFAQQLDDIAARRISVHAKLDAFIDIFDTVGSEGKSCLCAMMAAEVETLSDANRALLASFFRDAEGWVQRLLEDDEAALGKGLPRDDLARVIVSGLEGALLLDRVNNGRGEHVKAQRALVARLFD